jgi:hypothetical protein
MSVVPGDLDTDRGPPMSVPLRHFLVGLGFLLAGAALGVADALGAAPGLAALAHVHLLLVGWVMLTVLGAMTQFVPVWSGTSIHSRRLARWQLWLVAVGVAGLAGAFALVELGWVHAFGGFLLAGLWLFAYNVGRTLWGVRPLDVTERHFALALCFLVVLSTLGYLLAMNFSMRVFPLGGVTHAGALAAHATLAVYGAVLTTVFGALYQLATVFTQTELDGVDRALRRLEEVGYPLGVVALATGRLLGVEALARVGGLLVLAGTLALSVVLARKLRASRVPRTPMLSRYAVAAVALAAWAVLSLPHWLSRPLAFAALFGAPNLGHLLLVGGVGFVVTGTLYHVVPFIVWVNRYSDRVGLEPVPMIDDLYDDRLARADFAGLLGGGLALVAGDLTGRAALVAVGGGLATLGLLGFAVNLLFVVHRHAPGGLLGVAVGGGGDGAGEPKARIDGTVPDGEGDPAVDD